MQLLKLRYLQIRRDLGFWTLAITAAAFYVAHGLAGVSSKHGLGLTTVVLVALYSLQFNRNDHVFIRHYLDRPRLQILLNYNLLILPVSLALLVQGLWPLTLILHVLAAVISQLRPKAGGQRLLFIHRLVPSEQFEWISGLRNNFYLVLFLLLIAIVLCPVKFFGLLALFLLNSVFLGFYNFCEPLLMLNPKDLNSESFLNRKVNYFTKILLLTNSPLLLVNILMNFDSAWFSLGFLFGFILLAACSVYIKYAHYRPNDTSGFRADFLILFGGVILPYFLPLCIYLYYSNRKKAISNLSHYLHDSH